MHTLNLGILAHVDAGKTSLTERLLFEAGVIAEPGSVDAGTTLTDSMDVERRRGITVRTNVASFAAGGVQVNLIDTPGHSDFIAEVERSLAVLDVAVLVVSACPRVRDFCWPGSGSARAASHDTAYGKTWISSLPRTAATCPRRAGSGGTGAGLGHRAHSR